MNIVQAKAISLCRVFAVWELHPTPTFNGFQLYPSPFNPKQKTMLVINPETNTWVDPVTNEEGDTVQLVVSYLESQHLQHNVMDALRWLRNMIGNEHRRIELPDSIPNYKQADSCFKINDCTYLSDPLLMQYVEETRGIPFHIAMQYFKQVIVLNQANSKRFIALGVENEDSGFAIRNPLHKAHIGKRAITFVRGRKHKPSTIHVFKDMFDYLSIVLLRNGKRFDGDSIILNSYDCYRDMTAYIRNYGYRHLCSWMPNDEKGNVLIELLNKFSSAEQLQHHNMQNQTKGFYDLNDRLLKEVSLPSRKI
ncbi:MAG: hypothetical protein R2800_03535 [Flavipsychrobacter sp.]